MLTTRVAQLVHASALGNIRSYDGDAHREGEGQKSEQTQ